MASQYPNGIDNTTTLPTVYDNITEVKADTVNRLRDTLFLIEGELGIRPRGLFASVAARLDNFDTALDGYLQLTGGTLTGSLLFSLDNIHDIGASGATRPRIVYAGTAMVSPSIGPSVAQQHVLPAVTSDEVALLDATQTFSNKSFNSPVILDGSLIFDSYGGDVFIQPTIQLNSTLPGSSVTLLGGRGFTSTPTDPPTDGGSNTYGAGRGGSGNALFGAGIPGDTTLQGGQAGASGGGDGGDSGWVFIDTLPASGTGDNDSGSIVIDTGTKTGAGTTGAISIGAINASTVSIGNVDGYVYVDGYSISIGHSDGYIGFYGADASQQPTATGGTSGFIPHASANAVYNESTWTGGIGSAAYTITDIVAALKKLGLIDQ